MNILKGIGLLIYYFFKNGRWIIDNRDRDMKFKILLLSFIATSCYANESTADPDICNIVKKVAYNVMEHDSKKYQHKIYNKLPMG